MNLSTTDHSRPGLLRVVLLPLWIGMLTSCRSITDEVLETDPVPRQSSELDADRLFQRAKTRFRTLPRDLQSVAGAFADARGAATVEHPERYERLIFAAVSGLWLAQFAEVEALRSSSAERVIVLTNTAVALEPERAEGFYYRSIATGLFARENQSYGFDAMERIRDDARQARKLDPTLDDGGPDRVLGLLYLRAPGAPTGVGSLKRAEFHLREAFEAFPDRAENPLYLAECSIARDEDDREIDQLLDSAAESLQRSRRIASAAAASDPIYLEALGRELDALRNR